MGDLSCLRCGVRLFFAGTVVTCLSLGPAAADPEEGAAGETASKAAFDILIGITATNDYVSRGVSNSDSGPAIQGYIEPGFGWAYLNVWSSNVDFGEGFRGAEIDVSGGLKRWYTDDPLWFDAGYIHYFYSPEEITPDYGEIFGKLKYRFADFSIGAEAFYAPDIYQSGTTATYLEGVGDIHLSDEFALSAAVGYQFFQDENMSNYLSWKAGLSYTWEEAVTLAAYYSDTDLTDEGCLSVSGLEDACGARFVMELSFDTSWSALADRGKEENP
ncbi:TorF family putative porin [Mesorhizobium sp. YM1C-6-2]|uniref:TorF family putative porin n=1 Tax=Mesorhizobium sp. YM1C-6-2 TaxID=1827501 RepID=UPI000EF1F679|nr:TorF family putative porin [Mesorhizobium sp. YM1C-6-2]RLP23634.1 hypothetical protein D8676_18985 [Mesorhizobium sp. YM1C-6-2]